MSGAKLLSLMLSRSHAQQSWGFALSTSTHQPSLHVSSIDGDSLAAQHLAIGDRVLEIEGIDTILLSQNEVDQLIGSGNKHLELLVIKRSPHRRIVPKRELAKEVNTTEVKEDRKEKPKDSFWVAPECAPIQEEKEEITQSSIFNSLNDNNNQKKAIDPREEKRRFWERCHKGDASVRRFKWGDGIKPKGKMTDKFTSVENLSVVGNNGGGKFTKTCDDNRSKSCERETSPKDDPHPRSKSLERDDRIERAGANTNPFLNGTTTSSSTNPFWEDSEKKTDSNWLPSKELEDLEKFLNTVTPVNYQKTVQKERRGSESHKELFDQTMVLFEKRPGVVSEKADQILNEHFNRERSSYSCSPEVERRKTGDVLVGSADVSPQTPRRELFPREERGATATPAGFYDNFDRVYSEVVCEEGESFEEVRNRLGKLLGGKPLYKKKEDKQQESSLDNQEVFNELQRQSNQISGGGGPSPGCPPPPPPIPPVSTGIIPTMRIPTEIGPRKEPPAAIQNAMMTKDKKPFTYTPGGLDLAEIKSPRMAKRISQNALTEDSCTGAVTATGPPPPPIQPHQLPPLTVMAMQPQLAIPVLPPPPPPPPMPQQPSSSSSSSAWPPPPPPPPPDATTPSAPNAAAPKRPPGPQARPPPPDYIADIANHAHTLKRVDHFPKSNRDLESSNFPQVQLRPTGPPVKTSVERDPEIEEVDSAVRAVQLRPVPQKQQPKEESVEPEFLKQVHQVPYYSPVTPPSSEPQFNRQPKQPNYQQPSVYSPVTPPTSDPEFSRQFKQQQSYVQPSYSPMTPPSEPDYNRQMRQPTVQQVPTYQPPSPRVTQQQPSSPQPPAYRPPPPMASTSPAKDRFRAPGAGLVMPDDRQLQMQQQHLQQQQQQLQQQQLQQQQMQQEARQTPPALRQAPAPWMSAQRHSQKEVPTWASRTPSMEEPPTPPTPIRSPPVANSQPVTRIIPIHVEGRDSPAETSHNSGGPHQARTRIIPIQIEGSSSNSQNNNVDGTGRTWPTGAQQQQMLAQQQQMPAQQQQRPSWAGQQTPPPVQSRSFRVLQKITGSEPEQQGSPVITQY